VEQGGYDGLEDGNVKISEDRPGPRRKRTIRPEPAISRPSFSVAYRTFKLTSKQDCIPPFRLLLIDESSVIETP